MSTNQIKIAAGLPVLFFFGLTIWVIEASRRDHAAAVRQVPITAAPYFPEGRRPRCFRYNDNWRCSDGRTTTMDCTVNLCWRLCGHGD